MSTVHCCKYNELRPAMAKAPYPGPLGQKILEQASQEAWQDWIKHQTILINEYRLSPIDPKSKAFLETEMEKFFFGEGASLPPLYTESKSDEESA